MVEVIRDKNTLFCLRTTVISKFTYSKVSNGNGATGGDENVRPDDHHDGSTNGKKKEPPPTGHLAVSPRLSSSMKVRLGYN